MLRPAAPTLSLALLVAAGCGPPTPVPEKPVAAEPARPVAATPRAVTPAAPSDGLAADDGRTLWASPTEGEAIDPSLVPDAAGLFVHLRPAALLASDEGRRVWRALGPAGEAARVAIESAADGDLDSVETLVVGVAPGAGYGELDTAVAADPEPTDRLPLVQRTIEQLLETTDSQRHLTVVFSPRFLLGDGGSLLAGPWAPLRDLCLAQLRDEWAAASLSLHLDDRERLYWELRVVGSAAEPETRTAAAIAERARGWTDDVDAVIAGGEWAPYSAEVVRRSPAMWEVVGRYARRGVDGRQSVVNGYAPPGAAHQLALAGERIVAELAAPPATGTVAKTESEAASLVERLRRPVTIAFPRESLETAVAILSDTLGAPIEIRGRDLQLEGITRNQMLSLDVSDLPAAEALVEVLRRANPDPLAEGPADPRQRLVYVVAGDALIITTRGAAERRGDPLPDVFRAR